MKIKQPRLTAIAALAAAVLLPEHLDNVRGAESQDATATAPGPVSGFLVPEDELDDVNMSIIDEKLAMSLAVEIHVHMKVMESALNSMSDPELKAYTQQKVRVYGQLYNSLNELSGGRVESTMARAAWHPDGDPAADENNGHQTKKRATRKRRHGGGLGNVLQGAATKAVVRVRLEIAEQYALLLRAELEASPPGQFDRRYMNVEFYNQMQVLSMLRVFEQQASPDFGRIIHLATAAVESHMLEARQLVEHLKAPVPLPPTAEEVVATSDASGT